MRFRIQNDTCAWTPNKINLEFKNADRQAIGSWAQVTLGTLGTQAATGNPDIQAIGSWAQVPLGTLGTQAANTYISNSELI